MADEPEDPEQCPTPELGGCGAAAESASPDATTTSAPVDDAIPEPDLPTLPTTQDIRDHYSRARVKATIMRCAFDPFNDTWRCGNGDFRHWWTPDKSKYRIYDLSNGADYDYLTFHYRTLYWSLNYFDKKVRTERSSKREDGKIWPPVGTRRTTRAYSLGVDVDTAKVDGYKQIGRLDYRHAVEAAVAFISTDLRGFFPQSVYAAFSGGGAYVLLHHRCIADQLKHDDLTDEEWDVFWEMLHRQFNAYIRDMEDRFFRVYPKYLGLVKFDALNTSKRVFKTIFGIHKSLPFPVVPLDPEHPVIDLERARLPLADDVLAEGERWYTVWDHDGIELFLARLRPHAEEAMAHLEPEDATREGVEILPEPVPLEMAPPCIQTLLTMDHLDGAGGTRAVAFLSAYLGQTGVPHDEAMAMVAELGERFGVGGVHGYFHSWYSKMSVPRCMKIRTKGSGYPHMDLGELGLCHKDDFCTKRRIYSPFKYAKKKWQMEKAPAPTGDEVSPEARAAAAAKAKDLIEKDGHVGFVMATLHRRHKSDDEMLEMLLASGVAVAIRAPKKVRLPILTVGRSQGGKTHAEETVAAIMPRSHCIMRNSVSPKGLYYMGMKDARALDGKLLVIDELGDLVEETLAMLKGLTSYDCDRMVHQTVIHQEAAEIALEGLPTLWTNACETEMDPTQEDQTFNRWLLANIDESKETTGTVTDGFKDAAIFGPQVDVESDLVAKEVVKALMARTDFDVRIPYAQILDFSEIPNARINAQKFLDLIRAEAFLHWPSRPRLDVGGREVFLATWDDFLAARRIWKKFHTHIYGHVDAVGFKVLRALMHGLYQPTMAVLNACRASCDVSDRTLRRKLEKLETNKLASRIPKVRLNHGDDEHPQYYIDDMWAAEVDPISAYHDGGSMLRASFTPGTGVDSKIVTGCQLVEIRDPVDKDLVIGLKIFSDDILDTYNNIYNIIINNNNNRCHESEGTTEEGLAAVRATVEVLRPILESPSFCYTPGILSKVGGVYILPSKLATDDTNDEKSPDRGVKGVVAEKVRKFLKSAGTRSARGIAEAVGEPEDVVQAALDALVNAGEVVSKPSLSGRKVHYEMKEGDGR